MSRIWLALKAFWQVLVHREAAQQVERALVYRTAPSPEEGAKRPQAAEVAPPAQPPSKPARSEALTLLAALQREARFLDLVQESLDSYTDAQIGAAARDVLRDCRRVLQRMFALEPLLDEPEGAEIETPAQFDAGEYRLTGNVTGDPPYRGVLAHAGWRATACEVPQWNGSESAARVVAPAEVELK